MKLSESSTSASLQPPWDDVLPIGRALVDAAPSQCVWATDWPHPGFQEPLPNDGALMDVLEDWAPMRKHAEPFWWTTQHVVWLLREPRDAWADGSDPVRNDADLHDHPVSDSGVRPEPLTGTDVEVSPVDGHRPHERAFPKLA